MKKIIYCLIFAMLLSSCANSKMLTINGEEQKIKPYGWANEKKEKNDNVVYELSSGNVLWSIIGFRTLVVPIWLTGWKLFEPVEVKK